MRYIVRTPYKAPDLLQFLPSFCNLYETDTSLLIQNTVSILALILTHCKIQYGFCPESNTAYSLKYGISRSSIVYNPFSLLVRFCAANKAPLPKASLDIDS